MGGQRIRLTGAVAIAALGALGGGEAQAENQPAKRVLARYCSPCHGGTSVGPKASKGGFGYVLDVSRLTAEGQIIPGDPDRSALYQKVRDGDMPPRRVKRRPSAAELATLRTWISGLARSGQRPVNLPDPRSVDAVLRRDLAGVSPRAQPRTRYVSLLTLARAGANDAELGRTRQAITKLLNSLSWRPVIARFTAIGPRGAIMRIDLASIGWTSGMWDLVAMRSPYAYVRHGRDARHVRTVTGTHAPLLRADWLAAEVSRPPLYHRLARIPRTEADLFRKLNASARDAIFGRRVIRAGFAGSGVSRHNRIIERHPLAGAGYLWRSFDFRSSTGRRNIFKHPLEPALAKRGFVHDGGELIFSLPNGLQGYMLTDARGNRIDAAPTSIVTDPSRPDGVVRNGLSCMGCHQRGIIDKQDALRPHLQANRLALSRNDLGLAARALALYRSPAALATAMRTDRARFETALTQAGVSSRLEPIGWLVQRYETAPSSREVAAELGMDRSALSALLTANPDVSTLLGSIARGGSVKRDVLARAFPKLVGRFGLGRPLGSVSQSDRDQLSCRSGGRRACVRAAKAADKGRLPARAFRLHEAACAAGSSRSCHVAGQRLIDGVGARRDLGRAASYLSRSCGLERASACVTLGNLHFNGGGVPRSRSNALGFYSRACQLGSARGCGNAAIVYETGGGVPVRAGRAVRLYERACRGDIAKSCARAATLYYDGRAIRRDRGKAARLFDRACRGGVGSACRQLAVQYRWGLGVSADWIRSERLFRRACRLGVNRACLYL